MSRLFTILQLNRSGLLASLHRRCYPHKAEAVSNQSRQSSGTSQNRSINSHTRISRPSHGDANDIEGNYFLLLEYYKIKTEVLF